MTALQPLTDVQVKNRLKAYNKGGSLERDIRSLWEAASDIIRDCARAHFGEPAVAVVERHYTSKVDAAWVQNVADFGQRLYSEQQSVPEYIASRDKLICGITLQVTMAGNSQHLRMLYTFRQFSNGKITATLSDR